MLLSVCLLLQYLNTLVADWFNWNSTPHQISGWISATVQMDILLGSLLWKASLMVGGQETILTEAIFLNSGWHMCAYSWSFGSTVFLVLKGRAQKQSSFLICSQFGSVQVALCLGWGPQSVWSWERNRWPRVTPEDSTTTSPQRQLLTILYHRLTARARFHNFSKILSTLAGIKKVSNVNLSESLFGLSRVGIMGCWKIRIHPGPCQWENGHF